MTNEEAIDLLDNLIGMVDDNHDSDYDTAFKMAIQALEQEPSGDAVSRQAVIDVVNNPLNIRLDEIIKQLPSVKPQPCEDAVSREAVDDILCLYSDGNGMIDAGGAVRMVRELPSVNPQKWIPVSERLPQVNEWVLCQCRTGYKVLRLTSYRCYRNDTQEYMDSFVIAWMPLPKPYEPTCDTCEYNTAAFNPCNACKDKSEYEPQESEE